jgi:predicted deacetylase
VSARYLVRFDDVCPGMNWPIWREVEKILVAADVKPMLAVIPANEDPRLNVCDPEPRFWDLVRGWQERGWAIGLHGYQHRYVTGESGLVGLNRRSEFAGVPAHVQADKLRAGLAIFRRESVRADLWIAPGHSFDGATVAALRDLGVPAISDGLFLSEHRDEHEMLWIPQQMWRFHPRPFGLWTVCYHVNGWKTRELARFERDVAAYRARITSLANVVADSSGRRRGLRDELVSRTLLATIRSRRWLRGRLG